MLFLHMIDGKELHINWKKSICLKAFLLYLLYLTDIRLFHLADSNQLEWLMNDAWIYIQLAFGSPSSWIILRPFIQNINTILLFATITNWYHNEFPFFRNACMESKSNLNWRWMAGTPYHLCSPTSYYRLSTELNSH